MAGRIVEPDGRVDAGGLGVAPPTSGGRRRGERAEAVEVGGEHEQVRLDEEAEFEELAGELDPPASERRLGGEVDRYRPDAGVVRRVRLGPLRRPAGGHALEHGTGSGLDVAADGGPVGDLASIEVEVRPAERTDLGRPCSSPERDPEPRGPQERRLAGQLDDPLQALDRGELPVHSLTDGDDGGGRRVPGEEALAHGVVQRGAGGPVDVLDGARGLPVAGHPGVEAVEVGGLQVR